MNKYKSFLCNYRLYYYFVPLLADNRFYFILITRMVFVFVSLAVNDDKLLLLFLLWHR